MNKLIIGDCRKVMRKLIKDGIKVQTCVTSPPYYGLRDYGHVGQIGLEEIVEQYVRNLVKTFRLVKELLADDGTLWLNLGDSYAGSGRGRVKDGSFHEGSLAGKQGTSKGSTQGKLPKQSASLPAKNLIGVPWRVALALQADGWILRQDIIWHKPNAMPEAVTDRCVNSHEHIFLLSKSPRYHFDHEAIKEPSNRPTGERTSRDDFKRDGSKRGAIPGQATSSHRVDRPSSEYDLDTRNRRSVWSVLTRQDQTAHFATFPPQLIEPCVLAGARPGDVVFDPFFGSGTTAEVANNLGRQWLGIELNPEYEGLHKAKIEQQALQLA